MRNMYRRVSRFWEKEWGAKPRDASGEGEGVDRMQEHWGEGSSTSITPGITWIFQGEKENISLIQSDSTISCSY